MRATDMRGEFLFSLFVDLLDVLYRVRLLLYLLLILCYVMNYLFRTRNSDILANFCTFEVSNPI